MSREHDLRRGAWGNALHADLWKKAPDWTEEHRRYSCLAHLFHYPSMGDRVRYLVEGGERTASIYDFRPLGDPDDMHELFLEIEP